MKNRIFKITALLFIVITFWGCPYGLVGRKTTQMLSPEIDKLNSTVTTSRDTILYYLKNQLGPTAHDASIGIMQGTIGYIDAPENRKNLVRLLDTLIRTTGGDSRKELVALKNSLLGDTTSSQINKLLDGVMNSLIEKPTANLLNIALSDETRTKLDLLLRMVIPAILNDHTLNRLDSLREILVGKGMRNDIVALEDTVLGDLNSRLSLDKKGSLGNTITAIIQKNGEGVKHDANAIVYSIGGIALVLILITFLIQQYRIKQREQEVSLKNDMLSTVAGEIEKIREKQEPLFKELTGNIRHTMLSKGQEGELRKFLFEKGINKTL